MLLDDSTVSGWLSPSRPSLPSPDQAGNDRLITYLMVCGEPPDAIPAWLSALERVRSGTESITTSAAPTALDTTTAAVPPTVAAIRDRRFWAGFGLGAASGSDVTVGVIALIAAAVLSAWLFLSGPRGSDGPGRPAGPEQTAISSPTATVAPAAPQLHAVSLPVAGSAPVDIAVAADGSAWFTEFGSNKIGHVTAAGALREFDQPEQEASLSRPFAITAGPDGMWFTEGVPAGDEVGPGGNRIGLITSDGTITTWPIPTPDAGAVGITVGPDGLVWFTEQRADRIGRLNRDGTITEFPIGSPSDGQRRPNQIISGPDGNLWFTEFDARKIGRITPRGQLLAEYDVSAGGLGPVDIITHGGELWFTVIDGKKIGRIDPAGGDVRWIDVPTAGALGPANLAESPDRRGVWFTELSDAAISYIADAPTPAIGPRYTLPAGSHPIGIAVGPDGTVWFTQNLGNRIGWLTTT